MINKTLKELAQDIDALANELKAHKGKRLYRVSKRLKAEANMIRKEDEAREELQWAKRLAGALD